MIKNDNKINNKIAVIIMTSILYIIIEYSTIVYWSSIDVYFLQYRYIIFYNIK